MNRAVLLALIFPSCLHTAVIPSVGAAYHEETENYSTMFTLTFVPTETHAADPGVVGPGTFRRTDPLPEPAPRREPEPGLRLARPLDELRPPDEMRWKDHLREDRVEEGLAYDGPLGKISVGAITAIMTGIALFAASKRGKES